MYLNNKTQSNEVGFLQTFLSENVDENLAVSNEYNKATHSDLLYYMQFPEVSGIDEIIEEIRDHEMYEGQPLFYLFTIENNIDKVSLRQKVGCKTEKELVSVANSLFDIKEQIHSLGWSLTYSVDDDNRFSAELTQLNDNKKIPRKDLAPLVNMTGIDTVDYYVLPPNQISYRGSRAIKEQEETACICLNIIDATKDQGTPSEEKYTMSYLLEYPDYVEVLRTQVTNMGDDFNASESFKFGWSGMELYDPVTQSAPGTLYYKPYRNTDQSLAGEVVPSTAKNAVAFLLWEAENHLVNRRYTEAVFQLTILKNKKRLYFAHNIENEKYYAISHSNSSPLEIRYGFCSEDISIKKLRAGYPYQMNSNVKTLRIYKDETVIIKSPLDETSSSQTLVIETSVPIESKPNKVFEIQTELIYGDLNMDGKIDLEDMKILQQNRYNLNAYNDVQKAMMKSRKGVVSCTTYYKELTYISADDFAAMELIITNQMYSTSSTQTSFYTIVPQEVRDQMFYVGRVPDYNVTKIIEDGIPAGSTIEAEIAKIFANLKFSENPFLVHSKFMDYMLDSAIHLYSDDDRIRWLYDELEIDPDYTYIGYDKVLKDVVYAIQEKNDILFRSGYADVDTLYLIREGT